MLQEFRELIPMEQWPSDGKLPAELFYWYEPVIAEQEAYLDYVLNRTNSINGRRYREDPTILAWELTNEARCQVAAFTEDDGKNSPLPAWARQMSEALRRSGATQLIAWGGAGYRGTYGEDIRTIAETAPEIDILTLHLYPWPRDADSLTPSEALKHAEAAGANAVREIEALAQIAHELGSRGTMFEELGWRSIGRQAKDQEDIQRSVVFSLAGCHRAK